MRISDWSSDVCSSDLPSPALWTAHPGAARGLQSIGHPHIGTAQGTLLAYQPRINPAGAPTASPSPRVFLFALPQGRCATWHTPHDTPGAWHSLLGTLPSPGGQTGAGEHQGRQIGRAHAELQSLMRNSYAVFGLK